METMETLENHGNHGNRRCGIETVANHIEIMETMENLRKHRPRSGGTSEPNLEVQANQIWRYKRTPALLTCGISWRDPWLVSRSARRLIFAFAVAFVTSPSPRAWRRAFLRQSRATTPAMKSEGSACSRGLDLMSDYVHCLQMGHGLCTDYAPIILVTAIWDCNGSKRRQIVTDTHCRAADVYFWGCKDWKEGKKSEWSKLLLASESSESESVPDGSCLSLAHAWGRLPRPTRPLSAQHALSLRKQSNTKWEKMKCVKYVETILNYFFTASNPFRFVANLSGSHQRNFQRPERGATSSQDESPPGLCFSKFRTQKKHVKLQKQLWIEWIIWIIWN